MIKEKHLLVNYNKSNSNQKHSKLLSPSNKHVIVSQYMKERGNLKFSIPNDLQMQTNIDKY